MAKRERFQMATYYIRKNDAAGLAYKVATRLRTAFKATIRKNGFDCRELEDLLLASGAWPTEESIFSGVRIQAYHEWPRFRVIGTRQVLSEYLVDNALEDFMRYATGPEHVAVLPEGTTHLDTYTAGEFVQDVLGGELYPGGYAEYRSSMKKCLDQLPYMEFAPAVRRVPIFMNRSDGTMLDVRMEYDVEKTLGYLADRHTWRELSAAMDRFKDAVWDNLTLQQQMEIMMEGRLSS